MRIGRLDRKITVQRPYVVTNAFNEEEQSWLDLYVNIWAGIRTQSGGEALKTDRVEASQVVVFTLRYCAVLPTDRVVFEGQVYEIVQPPHEIGRRKGLELICQTKLGPEGLVNQITEEFIFTDNLILG